MSNPIDYDALTPEQRNQLLAEKIFSLDPHCTGKLIYSYAFAYYECEECKAIIIAHQSIPESHTRKVPDYCTDLNAAWQVVEHMTKLPEVPHEGLLHARFAFWFDRANLWSMKASDVADAICRAAWQIVSEEVQG